jgi:membrane-associated phospholipid phosphatase
MSREIKGPILASLACVAGVIALGSTADDIGPIRHFDLHSVLRFEHRATADSIAGILVHLGDPAVFVVLAVAVVISPLYLGRRREAVAALVVLAGANLTTQILKVVFENPHLLYEPRFELTRTNGFPGRDSFPSGHTTAIASIVIAALFAVPAPHRMTVEAVGLLLTAAVGISVVVLGWHFPTDVIGGLLVAGAWGFAVLAGLRRWQSRGGEPRRARQ